MITRGKYINEITKEYVSKVKVLMKGVATMGLAKMELQLPSTLRLTMKPVVILHFPLIVILEYDL